MGKTGEREGITPELMSFQPVKSDDQRDFAALVDNRLLTICN